MRFDPDKMKTEFFFSLRNLIEVTIDRYLDFMELGSLAFLIEKKWYPEIDNPLLFLSKFCGVDYGDSSFEAAFKIHNTIFDAKIKQVEWLQEETVVGSDEWQKIRLLRVLMSSAHYDVLQIYSIGTGKIHLGGISRYWLPQWAAPIFRR
jgi:hypothetical protein